MVGGLCIVKAKVMPVKDMLMVTMAKYFKSYVKQEGSIDVVAATFEKDLTQDIKERLKTSHKLGVENVGHICIFMGYVAKSEKPLYVFPSPSLEELSSIHSEMQNHNQAKLFYACNVLNYSDIEKKLVEAGFLLE